MKPFLYQVASLFYSQYGTDVSRMAFVFPNRRAGLFFQKYLAEISGKPLFSPIIFTISDFFLKLSGKQIADRISMLFTLYRIYIRKSTSEETFDEFLYWGEMLLNDFDDIDKYMVNARMLFSNVTDLRAIESDFKFLNERQIATIRSFWSSFYPNNNDGNKENFFAIWQILYDLYQELKEILQADGKGYEGMIAREVLERLTDGEWEEFPYERVVFVGLNALSVVEEKLLLQLQKRGIADFYWDYASNKVTDKENKASFFVERNRTLFPSRKQLPEEEPRPLPCIELIGIPSGAGQAKQLHSLLSETHAMSEEESLRTAIVLPDEHLLIPVLNSIPESIRSINVTMGYPLAGTPIASLVEYILMLHENVRYIDRQPSFYFRDVLPVLNHRYILSVAPEVISGLVKDVIQNNKIHIPSASLHPTPFLKTLFTPIEHAAGASDYLLSILTELNKIVDKGKWETEDEELSSAVNYQSSVIDIEQEFIFHFFAMVNRLKEVIHMAGVDMTLGTYFLLLKRLTDTITIPFRGEPLSGLQIMGVLETRALDFDRLIILSMNEGIFPQKKVAASFVPYNLRQGFGLPTYEYQDSVWAYHFYRLIHRASRVSFLYDTRNNGLQTGEMSRFIHQLHYHYQAPLRKKIVIYNVSSSQTPAIRIEKTDKIMEQLSAYGKGGRKAISASAINTWLDCPLKFYFSFVEGIQEDEEVSEMIESNVFGSILHKVMEDLYKPLEGNIVTADLLKAIRKDASAMSHTIAAAFARIFFKTQAVHPLTGQNFLIGEMIRKYAEKIFERDSRELTPFRYIASEKRMNTLITLSDGTTDIQLKGFIDRIDEVRGATRIIDYKSGKGASTFRTVESLFDANEKDRAKAVMQVFMYAWLFGRLPENNGKTLRPGIYYMRTLFPRDFDSSIYQHAERGKAKPVEDFSAYASSFETALRVCLDEIFSAEKPFIQTSAGKSCAYCLFKHICG